MGKNVTVVEPMELGARKYKNKQETAATTREIRKKMQEAKEFPAESRERLALLDEINALHQHGLKLISERECLECTHKWKFVDHTANGDFVKCETCGWGWNLPCLRTTIAEGVWSSEKAS